MVTCRQTLRMYMSLHTFSYWQPDQAAVLPVCPFGQEKQRLPRVSGHYIGGQLQLLLMYFNRLLMYPWGLCCCTLWNLIVGNDSILANTLVVLLPNKGKAQVNSKHCFVVSIPSWPAILHEKKKKKRIFPQALIVLLGCGSTTKECGI